MQTSTITLKAVAPAGTAPRVGPRLEPGSDLVARLISAPQNGGRGLISMAGMMLEAQLPGGLLPGQKLHLKVVEAQPEVLRVRIVTQSAEADEVTDVVTKLAGELAARGDGALLRAALHFADGSPTPRRRARRAPMIPPAGPPARRASSFIRPTWARSRFGCAWRTERSARRS